MKYAKFAAMALATAMYSISFAPAQAFIGKPLQTVNQQEAGNVIEVSRSSRRRNRALAGGLVAGAIIGGALARDRYRERRYYDDYRPRRVRRIDRHEAWCYDRYRSYRAYDNTYQPYDGPRRECYSPYS